MTERVSRLANDSPSVAGLIDSSLQLGGAISLAFSDGILHIMIDQKRDWTITVGVSTDSERLESLTRSLEKIGFFHAAEQDGMIYHLWTSMLSQNGDDRDAAEETVLKVLVCFQTPSTLHYIS